ncbi:MAG: KpsF/GutQ family sugar-phosphate isomerase [Burkholderiaceae bacterium]|nr:KpsF/GutQ family sugar-phosphate isomerase [Burkholderiaceae bacterium]
MDAQILAAAQVRRRLVERAVEVLRIEADAVAALVARVDDAFVSACEIVLACRGRVVVSGMGKSGHVARKIAATLASTGTPAFFVHPADASHGDLGMITSDDVLLALSNSGTTDELLAIVPLVKRRGARLVAITGNPDSTLARLADAHLDATVEREACPLNLAPTASSTAMLAMGDALAVAVLDARGFSEEDFARSHPGGALGRLLLTQVADVMRTADDMPVIAADAPLSRAVLEITRKRMGMTAVLEGGKLAGIFTDGDLRRLLEHDRDIRSLKVGEVMTTSPSVIAPNALAAQAARMMEERRISQLLVVDTQGALCGALHIHDLLSAKVV